MLKALSLSRTIDQLTVWLALYVCKPLAGPLPLLGACHRDSHGFPQKISLTHAHPTAKVRFFPSMGAARVEALRLRQRPLILLEAVWRRGTTARVAWRGVRGLATERRSCLRSAPVDAGRGQSNA